MPTPRKPSNFVSDAHAIYCGWVLALMQKAELPFTAVADADNNFTNRVTVTTDLPGVTLTLVIPPPPDDWDPVDALAKL